MIGKILIGLAALIVGFVAFVAMQPSKVRVVRTAQISAPPADVFQNVNDLRKWDQWSPWAKLDPNSKVSFEGPQAGEGAVFKWSGNDKVGAGQMRIVESRPAERINIKVDFTKPFEGSTASEFAFKGDGGGTAVTWTSTSHNNFIGKAMCLFVNIDKMLGGDMEKGLAQLKAAAERKG